jgi:hypothetical protein
MNPLYIYFALFYVVPFGIAFAMPGWRSLSGYGLIFGSLLIWLFVSGSNGGGNGFSVALGLTVVMFAGGGLISGVVTRAIFLVLGQSKKAIHVRALIGVVGFVLLPGLVFSQVMWKQWQRRPPSESCMSARYPVSIAGAKYYLPPAPNLTVWTGMSSLYAFQSNEGIRTICEKATESSEPIRVVNLSMDNKRIRFVGYPVQSRYCQAPQSRWGKDLCNAEYSLTNVSYPLLASIYSPTEFRRMLVSYSYADFVEARERAKANNTPLALRSAGIFDRYGDSYWVARDGIWENEAGEPFTLHCYESAPAGMLGCSVTYRLKTGPQVTYQFHASIDSLETVARRVDKSLRAMIVELSQP